MAEFPAGNLAKAQAFYEEAPRLSSNGLRCKRPSRVPESAVDVGLLQGQAESGSNGSAGRGSLRAHRLSRSPQRNSRAYLGTMMPEVAGLALSATQREPKQLMVACEARYFGCQPSNEILAFHRRLINSGFVRT
jgi:hypothetical protein